MRYSIEPRTRKHVKGYGFSSFAAKCKKQLLGKWLDVSKKGVHKAGEYLEKKIADAATRSNDVNIEEQEPVEEIIRLDLCDYSDAHIVVKWTITVISTENDNRRNKKLVFKNNAPFRSCLQKSITHLQTVEKILILLCQFIIS